jgi:hypothetical protein
MNWKFWKKKDNDPVYYEGLTKKQFDSFIAGDVIGFVWKPESYKNLSDNDIDTLYKAHKTMNMFFDAPFLSIVPCVCLYYEYFTEEQTSELHVFFETPVKESLLIGNMIDNKQLIHINKNNSHLTTQAKAQIKHNKDVEEPGGQLI